MKKNLVFSGVQPTGNLHLGNYLGAIKNWVKMQETHECVYCIVDLHAITVPQNPKELKESILNTAATYLACGIDPAKSIIFNQSTVSGHSELAWILGCSTPMGWLNRMTQFKDKAKINNAIEKMAEKFSSFSGYETIGKLLNRLDNNVLSVTPITLEEIGDLIKDSKTSVQVISLLLTSIIEINSSENNKSKANLGLYSYPVLMAADILLYKATHVPVGEDQKQHLELARDIAGAFNRQYKTDFFPIPEPMILGEATRVMSLNDGTRKMSKSEESDYSRVNLTDDATTIHKKFMKAKSDSTMGFEFDKLKERPEAENLFTIYSALTGTPKKELVEKLKNAGWGALKKELADAAVSYLEPISKEIARYKADKAGLEKVLKDGAEKAGSIAEQNMKKIKELVGFYIP